MRYATYLCSGIFLAPFVSKAFVFCSQETDASVIDLNRPWQFIDIASSCAKIQEYLSS